MDGEPQTPLFAKTGSCKLYVTLPVSKVQQLAERFWSAMLTGPEDTCLALLASVLLRACLPVCFSVPLEIDADTSLAKLLASLTSSSRTG